ncbi:MAG TPA: class I adenylate-forming enzyme family protein [Solirubrobacterales bacterium]|nr:class I adenylate-forming enzyme family protein [Solirubrobacterales bacterium]
MDEKLGNGGRRPQERNARHEPRSAAEADSAREPLGTLVARLAASRPDEPALIGDSGALSWSRYDELGDALAGALEALALPEGAPVAVRLPDGPAVHVAYLACERAGIPVVAIAVRSGRAEIAHLLERTGAAAIVGEPGGIAVPGGLRTLALGDVAADDLDGVRLDGRPLASPHQGQKGRATDPHALFLLNSTSGTTGLPKCVMHDQARWLRFAAMAIEAGDLRAAGPDGPGEVLLSAVPTPYGFGLWSSHFGPPLLAAPVVQMERFEVGRMLELVERHRVTVLACVTTQLLMALASPALAARDLSSLRIVFTGGEAVPAEAAARLEAATGAKVLQFYGSNENGAISVTRHDDPDEKRLGSAGRPIPAMNVRLYDGERDVTATGGPGQVASRGPTGSLGYWRDPEAERALYTADGWMLSGDLATIDAEGYLHLVGRASDLIIRGGKNISAAAVESEAATHPAVALAAAVAMPDPVFGERVCLFAELRDGASLTLAELCDHMRARGVSPEWLPERLEVLDSLPRSAGEKVAKEELRARAAELCAG